MTAQNDEAMSGTIDKQTKGVRLETMKSQELPPLVGRVGEVASSAIYTPLPSPWSRYMSTPVDSGLKLMEAPAYQGFVNQYQT